MTHFPTNNSLSFKGVICLAVLLVAGLLMASPEANAQIIQLDRIELEQKGSDATWTLISMKEKGLVIVRDRDKYDGNQKMFEIRMYDTLLHETSSSEIGINSRMRLVGYEYTPGYLYLLFRTGENDLAEALMIEYNLDTKNVERFDLKLEFNLRLTHFTVVNRHAILAGYVSREPAVLLFNVADKQLKVIPGFFTQDTELLDLHVNQNGTFNTLSVNRSSRSNKTLQLRTFDHTGVQLMNDEIPIDPDKMILSGLTSSLVRDELLIAGTYSTGNSKMATGYFSVLADPFKEQPINYYDFGQLNHFLDYLNTKRAEKIKASSQKGRERSKDPEFRVNVFNIKIEELPTGFFLLSEAYNNVSATNTGPYPYGGGMYPGFYNPGYSPYGYSPYSQRYYNSPYNFYQPVHSDVSILSTSVLAFNADGKLDWDHSLKIDDERRANLEQTADFWSDKNKIVIATKLKSELILKSRFKNNDHAGDTTKIITKKETEQIREESDDEGGIRHWYGKTFFVWGYHTVKDPAMKILEDRNRQVFYIVKANAY